MMPTDTKLSHDVFYRKMDQLLNIPTGSVQGSQALSSLKNWDSLTILEFIVLADTEFQRDLQPSQIAACKTVDDLAELTLIQTY